MILVTVEDEKVKFNLKNMAEFADTAPQKRLLDVGLELLRLSQKQVPHDKGTLQNSGDVVNEGGNVLVGYHTPYAHRLHEHPEYNFQKGRKGKYLTDPLIENISVFDDFLGRHLESDLIRAIK